MSVKHAGIGAVLGAVVTAGALYDGPDAGAQYGHLLDQIQVQEGFRGREYADSRGRPTIGFGTLLPLTRAEGRALLSERVSGNGRDFARLWAPWKLQGPVVRSALLRMAEQLGAHGVLEFHAMLAALADRDYERAAAEAESSKWAAQTPARAAEVAATFRGLARGTGD